jgi:hypothetical protein
MTALPPEEDLVTTRRSLHRVAEHVLSAALKRATGQITLRAAPGGFRTPALPGLDRSLAVDGADIVVEDASGPRRRRLTTVREAARFAGTEPGFPWTKHPPATPYEPDEPLVIDPACAAVLADWFALGEAALTLLAEDIGGVDGPPQLFPEHFDLGSTADSVNYGLSPGDETSGAPYAYVGPHEGPPAYDDFWNAPFGAARTIHELGTPEEMVAFFLAARARLTGARSQPRETAHVDDADR